MKKVILGLSVLAITLTSCGTKKKIAALEAQMSRFIKLYNS
jgi:chemotaxis protein MotB